jgi:hypothetical protein
MRWQNISLNSLGEMHIAEWAAATGARINHGYESEKTEGGIRALAMASQRQHEPSCKLFPMPSGRHTRTDT